MRERNDDVSAKRTKAMLIENLPLGSRTCSRARVSAFQTLMLPVFDVEAMKRPSL